MLLAPLLLMVGSCDDRPDRTLLDADGLRSGGLVSVSDMTAPNPEWNLDEEWAGIDREVVPGFAGFHLDPQTGEYVVSVADPERAEAARSLVESSLRTQRSRDVAVRTRTVTWGWDQLNTWKRELAANLRDLGEFWLTIRARENRLVLALPTEGAEPEARDVARALEIPDGVLHVIQAEMPVGRQSVRDHFRPVPAGVQLRYPSEYCTIGPNTYRGATRGYVTAGHCSETTFGVDPETHHQHSLATGHDIALEHTNPPPSAGVPYPTRNSDAAFYEYYSGVESERGRIARTEYPGVNQDGSLDVDPNHPRFRVLGKVPNAVQVEHELVNKVGRTTGWTQGQITDTCTTIHKANDGVDLLCQWVAALWSWVGDSGSPIFQQLGPSEPEASEVELWGVLWGGPPSDSSVTFYSTIASVEADLGTLHVECDPLPDPCDPILFIGITGPSFISSTGSYTWEADVTGGDGTYDYEWERRTNHQTSTCSYTTPWETVGTDSIYQEWVVLPGYHFDLRLGVESGTQSKSVTRAIGVADTLACPQ